MEISTALIRVISYLSGSGLIKSSFCRHYIYNKEKLQVDGTYTNLDSATMPPYDFYKPSDLYK